MSKTEAQRLAEVVTIVRGVQVLKQCPEYDEFKRLVDAFVRQGQSASGSIKFRGTKRTLQYVLTTRADRVSQAVLRYDEHV